MGEREDFINSYCRIILFNYKFKPPVAAEGDASRCAKLGGVIQNRYLVEKLLEKSEKLYSGRENYSKNH